MSFTYGFYDSINHDRTYNARQMSEIFDGIINDGVFESIGNKFMVSAVSGMQIKVGSGRAWFNHTWTNNDSDMPLTLDAAEPLYKRIDAIVLEVNENQDTRANSIKIIKGTPASTPSKPTLINTDGIHQHILGWITINGGATAITQANIENAIGTSATPYVTAILQVTNVDQLLAQWDAQFGEWFRNIQAQMEGDVATHLQQQISAINAEQTSSGVYYEDHLPYATLKKRNGEVLNMPEGWELGDIRTTSKTDLDSTWALCNGELVRFDGMASDAFFEMRTANSGVYRTLPDFTFSYSSYGNSPWRLHNFNGQAFTQLPGTKLSSSPSSDSILVFNSDGTPNIYPMNGVTGSRGRYDEMIYVEDALYCYPGAIINNTHTRITLYKTVDLITWTPITVTFDFSGWPSYTDYLTPVRFVKTQNGKYVWFVSTRDTDSSSTSKRVTLATANTIQGPFTFLSNPYGYDQSGFNFLSSGNALNYGAGEFGSLCFENKIYASYSTRSSSKYNLGVKLFDMNNMTSSTIPSLALTNQDYNTVTDIIKKDNYIALGLGSKLFISKNSGNSWSFVDGTGPQGTPMTHIWGTNSSFFFSPYMDELSVVSINSNSREIDVATFGSMPKTYRTTSLPTTIMGPLEEGRFIGYSMADLGNNQARITTYIFDGPDAIVLPIIRYDSNSSLGGERSYLKIRNAIEGD